MGANVKSGCRCTEEHGIAQIELDCVCVFVGLLEVCANPCHEIQVELSEYIRDESVLGLQRSQGKTKKYILDQYRSHSQ